MFVLSVDFNFSLPFTVLGMFSVSIEPYFEALRSEEIDFLVLHNYWLYLIAKSVKSYEEFVDVVSQVLARFRGRRRVSVDVNKYFKFVKVESKCFCGFDKQLVHVKDVVSSTFGRSLGSIYVCPGFILSNILKDTTMLIMSNVKVSIPGLVDLLPSNVRGSLLYKPSGSKVTLNQVLDILRQVDGFKVVIYGDRYCTAILDEVRVGEKSLMVIES